MVAGGHTSSVPARCQVIAMLSAPGHVGNGTSLFPGGARDQPRAGRGH